MNRGNVCVNYQAIFIVTNLLQTGDWCTMANGDAIRLDSVVTTRFKTRYLIVTNLPEFG